MAQDAFGVLWQGLTFMAAVGSLICGVSPNVYVLIFGRALSGSGAAGIFIAMLQILGQVVKLEKRPKLFGAFGAVFGLSSIIGPLIGVGSHWDCEKVASVKGALSDVASIVAGRTHRPCHMGKSFFLMLLPLWSYEAHFLLENSNRDGASTSICLSVVSPAPQSYFSSRLHLLSAATQIKDQLGICFSKLFVWTGWEAFSSWVP